MEYSSIAGPKLQLLIFISICAILAEAKPIHPKNPAHGNKKVVLNKVLLPDRMISIFPETESKLTDPELKELAVGVEFLEYLDIDLKNQLLLADLQMLSKLEQLDSALFSNAPKEKGQKDKEILDSQIGKLGLSAAINQERRNRAIHYKDRTLLRGPRVIENLDKAPDIEEGAIETTPAPKPSAQAKYQSGMLYFFLTITLPSFLGISVLILLCCFCMRTNGWCCRLFDERHPLVFEADNSGHEHANTYKKLTLV